MIPIFILIKTALAFLLVVFVYVFVLKMREWLKKRKIRRNVKGGFGGVIEAEIRQAELDTKAYLLGFSELDAVLIITHLTLASVAIGTFLFAVTEDLKLNRPFLFVDKSEIEKVLNDENNFVVILTLKNEGPVPALDVNLGLFLGEDDLNATEDIGKIVYGPHEEGQVWIRLSKDEIDMISDRNDPKVYFTVRLEYHDYSWRSYCTETKGVSVVFGGEYKLIRPFSNLCEE